MERTRSCEHTFFDGGGLIPPPERLRKVLVVGAGVAGLQTARQLLKLGCQVLVLEANDEIGGVWIRNYIGFGLQVPWRMYQFPEYPWPKDLQPATDYPTGQEVQEYVRSYCREYDLRRYIRFNCKLLRLRWCSASRQWDALYCDTFQEKFFKVSVDYTVICAGIYSQPYIPDYEGTDTYAGIQLHAKDFVDLSVARGRRVVIVGAGKTALDCVSSIVATNTATSVTLLYRQAHWPLPRQMLGTSVRRLLFNRAMTSMMPPYYTTGSAGLAASKAMAPLRKLFWKGMESLISRKFRITEQMRPRVHLPTDLFYGGQILDNTMDKLVRSEALLTIKGEINRFVRNGVILQDGNFVAADLVLYCTGYLKTYDYLEGEMRARLDLQKDGLYLYRNCLPCAVPHLAFIGSEVSTYNNILTHGLQALWLAHVLSGRTPLPSPVAIAEDVRAQQRWRRSVMPAQRSRGSVLMLYMMQYHDQLLMDMGQQSRRKGLNILAECFGAYTATDYKDLLNEDNTILAARSAEAQLAAAGVPPAVLAATVSGRTGVVPGGEGGSGGGAAAPGATRAPEQRVSGGSDISGITRAAGSTAAAAGGGGGGVASGGGAGTVLRTAVAYPMLEDRLFNGSSRAGTSISLHSASVQGYQADEVGSSTAGGLMQGVRPGSGQSFCHLSGSGAGASAAVAAVDMTPGAAARRSSPPRHTSVGAATTGRIPRSDLEADSISLAHAADYRPLSTQGVSGHAPAAANGRAAAAPVWARTEQHRQSARYISMRVSADLSAAGKRLDNGGGAAYGGPASAGAAVPRPKTAAALMSYASGARVIPRRPYAASSDSDVRASGGEAHFSEATAQPSPQTQLQGANAGVVLHVVRSDGSSSRSNSALDLEAATAAAAIVLQSATATDRLAAASLGSFTGRTQRDGGGGDTVAALQLTTGGSIPRASAAPPATASSAASALGLVPANPSSQSRLSRHTGPASPIPCSSTHHVTHGSAQVPSDAWQLPSVQNNPPGPQHTQHAQHVRLGLLNSSDVAEVVPRTGSVNSGTRPTGDQTSHLRSHSCGRSAPENTLAVAAASPLGNSRQYKGSSGGSSSGELRISPSAGDGDASGSFPQRDSHFVADASSLCCEGPTLVLPRSSADGTAGRTPLHRKSAAGTVPQMELESPLDRDCAPYAGCGGAGSGSRGGGAAGGTNESPRAAADHAGQRSFNDDVSGTEDMPEGLDAAMRVSLLAAVEANRMATGRESAGATRLIGTNCCGPLASSSDRSQRLSSCSRSHSSTGSQDPDGGICSSSASAAEASVLVVSGSNGGSGKAAGPRGASRVRVDGGGAGGGAASGKITPVVADGGGSGVTLASGPPPQPSTPTALPQPVGAPVWHGTATSDCRMPQAGAALMAFPDVFYGSPGSGALSLSLWHATAGIGRTAQGCTANAATGSGGGATESRLSIMGSGRLMEQSYSDDEAEPEGEGKSPATEAAAALESPAHSSSTVVKALMPDGGGNGSGGRKDVVSGRGGGAGGSGTPMVNVPGGINGGIPVVAMAALCRAGSSVGKSPSRRRSALPALAGKDTGVRDWRRAGSLARNADGTSAAAAAAAAAALAEGGNGGGAATAASAAAAAAAASVASAVAGGGWHLFPVNPSMGVYSTGSSGGQLYSTISLAGGIGIVPGGGVGSSAAVPSPVPASAALPLASELLVQGQPSRLSNGLTADGLTGHLLGYPNSGTDLTPEATTGETQSLGEEPWDGPTQPAALAPVGLPAASAPLRLPSTQPVQATAAEVVNMANTSPFSSPPHYYGC